MRKTFNKYIRVILAMAVILTQISYPAAPAASAADTQNLALGKAITENGHVQNYTAANANDGNADTYWEGAANSYPNTLTVDLGATQSVYQVVLKLNPSWGSRTQTLSVLTSTDNATYTTAAASAAYSFQPSNGNTVTIPFATTGARYVRLNFTGNSGATGGQAAEFEVYGTASGSTGTPDLVVTDISWSPANPSIGNPVTFRATIKNQGIGATPAGVVNGVSFFVDNTQVSWSDTNTGSIAAGASITVTANWGPNNTAAWTASQGSHTVMAWVDDINRMTETNEENNQYSKPLSIGSGTPTPTLTPTQAPGQPDLIITDLTLNPADPAAGSPVTFSVTIKNQGTGPTTAGVINGVSFFVDNTQVSWSDTNTGSIAVGASITVIANWGPNNTAAWTATQGSHTVMAWVDDINRISESNENNNQYSKTINVGDSTPTPTPTGTPTPTVTPPPAGGTPDLIVTDIIPSPASPLTGNQVTFSAVVKNQGTGATAAGTILGISFFVDDIQVNWSDNTTSSLAPGASVTLTSNGGPSGSAIWTATTGEHTILAFVDDVNRIAEAEESNNKYTESMVVTTSPMPDLIVTDLSYTPAAPVAGDTVQFTATVKNQGTAPGAPGIVSFAVNGTQVSASANNTTALPAGASTTVTGSWTSSSVGDNSLTATADSTNLVAESSEANNTLGINLTVSPKPGIDLTVTGISWSPSYVTAGNKVTFSAVVKNQGTQAGIPGVVAFKVDGAQVAAASSTASIAAGSSLTIGASGTWTAISGNHVISATVDQNNTTAETDETNNTAAQNLTVGSGGRGATMPYTRYESEDGSYGGGAALRSAPDFNYSLIASEASNQSYVALPSNGSYVEWTIDQGGAGVNMRFTLPDTSNGMGQNGSLDCYVNGTRVATISLSSYWSWQYFTGDQPGDAPNGGQAAFRFDEVHWKLATPLKAGDKLRIQKTNGDALEYGVDFVEVEPVPSAIAQPSNSLSVTAYGAIPNDGNDDLTAFKSCVSAAVSAGKSVYIPEGTFHLSNMWVITANNITVTGAGIWYTNLQFTSPNASSGGISLRITGTIDFGNVYINSMLRTRYNQNAVYKCFMDNFGTNSKIHDFWEEHFECGFWVGDYAHTPAIPADNLLIENGRIRNNLADGVNFCQGTKNSTVRNCSVRNNGDDGLAVWPDVTNGAPMAINNSFLYNTIENNWRAGGIGIFGGSGHTARYNYIKDCFMGPGIRLTTDFPGYHFENNTGMTFSDTTIVNCGTSQDCYHAERGAIDLVASGANIKNLTFENIDIVNAQRDGIQIGYGSGFSNIVFRNILIDGTGKDATTTSHFSMPHLGGAIFVYTGNGSATFINLTTRNIELPEINLIQNGFNAIFQ